MPAADNPKKRNFKSVSASLKVLTSIKPDTHEGNKKSFVSPVAKKEDKDNKRGSIKPAVIKVYESNLHFSVVSQWPEKRLELEDAPEILILFKRPTSYMFRHDTFILKLFSCFGKLCENRIHAYYGLANFKPLIARTNNTIQYVENLMKSYGNTSPTASVTSISQQLKKVPSKKGKGKKQDKRSSTKVNTLSVEMASSRTPSMSSRASKGNGSLASRQSLHPPVKLHPLLSGSKQHLLQEFYKSSYRTLTCLHNGITLYKQILLSLSFTRYAEVDLTHSEIKLTKGKSIVGSCMWLVIYALQQMQEDPDVEQWDDGGSTNSQLDPDLVELSSEVLTLVTLSFQAWKEMIVAIGVIEKMHKKTEALFHKQTHYFQSTAPPDSEHAIASSVHLKKYRRKEHDSLQLRKFDPSTVPFSWGKKHAFPRILYKTNYTKPKSAWRGFDPLSVKDKITHLKDLLKFVKLILESVKDSAKKIVEELQGRGGRKSEKEVRTPHHHHHVKISSISASVGVTCYDDGLDVMDEILSKKLAHIDWGADEIREFFETDKIFLDDMDLLTLGAGVTRAILHDARRTMHICYETSRLVDFQEFNNLPDYLKVYKTAKEEITINQNQQEEKVRKLSTAGANGNNKNPDATTPRISNTNTHAADEYDIEELTLELRNVATLFRNSPYYEIIKTLPIYCNQVGMTLQDADLVFTPSSEKLLSKPPPDS